MKYPLDPSSSTHPSPSSQPIRTQLLTSLTAQTSLLSSLFNALSSSNPSSATPSIPPGVQQYLQTLPSGSGSSLSANNAFGTQPVESGLQSIYRALEAVDAHFQTLVDEACEHQEAWDALMRKKAEAEDLERRVRETVIRLKEGKDELEEAVREGRKVREGIEKAGNEPVAIPTLLSVALNLAPRTSAPVSSLIPLQARTQHMPWPTEATMRAGILFRTNGSMSGVGDLGRIGDEQDQSKRVIEPSHAQYNEHAHVEERRTHDPDWVMDLDLNSDTDED